MVKWMCCSKLSPAGRISVTTPINWRYCDHDWCSVALKLFARSRSISIRSSMRIFGPTTFYSNMMLTERWSAAHWSTFSSRAGHRPHWIYITFSIRHWRRICDAIISTNCCRSITMNWWPFYDNSATNSMCPHCMNFMCNFWKKLSMVSPDEFAVFGLISNIRFITGLTAAFLEQPFMVNEAPVEADIHDLFGEKDDDRARKFRQLVLSNVKVHEAVKYLLPKFDQLGLLDWWWGKLVPWVRYIFHAQRLLFAIITSCEWILFRYWFKLEFSGCIWIRYFVLLVYWFYEIQYKY